MSKKGEGFIFILSNFIKFYGQMGKDERDLDSMIDACILELEKLKERHTVTAKKKAVSKKKSRK